MGPPGTGSFSVSEKDSHRLEPVSPGECLTLAAVLATAWSSDASGLLKALRAIAAGLDGDVRGGVVSRWLKGRGWSEEGQVIVGSPLPVVEQLGDDLRFGSSSRAASGNELLRGARARTAAGPHASDSLPSVEASVLLGVLGQLRDHLGLREQFGERLREARLKALQQLAYGAGHEINNPLANIAARGQSLLCDERDPERRRRLATIVDQAFRARDMIGGLMVYAKPPTPVTRPVNVGELVNVVIRSVAEAPSPAGVRIQYRPHPEAAWARGDGDLVAEALRAVVVNALQAVDDGGRVELSVEPVPGRESIAIVVADDGPGLEAELLEGMADPFFCGREAGRGLGIGLSKAWALVEVCGGRLSLASHPGLGSTVRIELPKCEFDGHVPE
jgi:signal transduction histidine kinase